MKLYDLLTCILCVVLCAGLLCSCGGVDEESSQEILSGVADSGDASGEDSSTASSEVSGEISDDGSQKTEAPDADDVRYYEGIMEYAAVTIPIGKPYDAYSTAGLDSFDNVSDSDWFVVGVENCSGLANSLLEEVGFIDIEDHPFLVGDYEEQLSAAATEEAKKAVMLEKYEKMLPDVDMSEYEYLLGEIPTFDRVGYMTKAMIDELIEKGDGVQIGYTFMPEVSNPEPWLVMP
ncbi:MAG: hypothetical protein IKK70_07475 [Clostridia bacterium]|nr:hypothetical protein [Clostridia bacterium]